MKLPTFALVATACLAIAAVLAAPARAQVNPAEAEVRDAAAAYLAALELGDAAAIAACWTDDGVFIDAEGASHPARDLVKQEFTALEKDQPRSPPPQVHTSVHFVGPTVAVEQSLAAAPGGAGQPAAGDAHFLAAWVKQGDLWKLSLVREFARAPSASPPRPAATPLGELDWLVGSWTANQDGAVVDMSVEWTSDRAFMLQRFSATRDGREVRRAPRIAWDAAAKQLRSWIFNADGSFGEASWKKEGDVWIVASTGVLPDGRRQKSVQFWTREGSDACWFKSLQGEVDGQTMPDLVLKFARRRFEAEK